MPSAAPARAFWITSPGRGEIRGEMLAAPGANEVQVRTEFTGISRGTESLVFEGRVPPAEYARMRAPFQAGEFSGAVKYGYSNAGIVEAGPAQMIGRRVFTLFPHQTRLVVPADAAYEIPDNVPSARAILAANLETALNAVWDAQVQTGDRVTIVGAGTVGCLVAYVTARLPGTRVTLCDLLESRAATAAALGASFTLPQGLRDDADVVFHASATSAGLASALGAAAFEATVLELSWYGTAAVTVPLGGAFHSRRLTLKSSQVGHIAAPQRARWSHRRRMMLALELLADPALDVLISGESDFDALPETMEQVVRHPESTLCHRIRYL